jgi:hypothetical protein
MTCGLSLSESAGSRSLDRLGGPWSDAGWVVSVEGNERAAYAPVTASAQFFRLVK